MMRGRGFSRERGFSIVELLIAMGLVAVVTAGVFGALSAGVLGGVYEGL